VVRSNKIGRKRLTDSNGTPAMVLVHMSAVLKQYYLNVLRVEFLLKTDSGYPRDEAFVI